MLENFKYQHATHIIDTEARLIITTWRGEAKDANFEMSLRNYIENIRFHPEYIS